MGLDVALLRRAGILHDVGKVNEDWQLQIGGGNGRLLAKSGGNAGCERLLPVGWRHEHESMVRLLPRQEPMVTYLVGTHHGHGRPWFAVQDTPDEWVRLVLQLRDEYGPWRLTANEAALRIADWRISAE